MWPVSHNPVYLPGEPGVGKAVNRGVGMAALLGRPGRAG
jgi:hypothetical protein